MSSSGIQAAGIYTMPADEYHRDPAPEPSLSNSLICTLATRTPRHAWMMHPRLNPAPQRIDSEEFDLGTAAHALLLESADRMRVIDAQDWRTKAAREARDEARAAGLVPVLPKQHAAVEAMTDAARAFIEKTEFAGIFARGKPEQAIFWREGETWCRALIDWLADDRSLIIDYKTTSANGPADFVRHMPGYGYDTQALWYPRGIAALGHRARFVFLVQEVAPPHLCYLVELSESMRELAASKIDRAMNLWRQCLASDSWPGYSPDIHYAEAPAWAMKEELIA